MSQNTCPYQISKFERTGPFYLTSKVDIEFGGSEITAMVKVRKYWNGATWYHFTPCYMEMGTEIELWTEDMWKTRYNAVRDNEGQDAAYAWGAELVSDTGKDRWDTHVADKISAGPKWHALQECNKIIEHFKHVVELGMIDLAVTL